MNKPQFSVRLAQEITDGLKALTGPEKSNSPLYADATPASTSTTSGRFTWTDGRSDYGSGSFGPVGL